MAAIDQRETSRFLALPAELRNRIYEFVLSVPTEDGRVTLSKIFNRRPTVLTILETCRQVHHEARKVFYHINHLRLNFTGAYDPVGCDLFSFDSLSADRMEAIEAMSLQIHRHPGCFAGAVQAASTLPKLHILELELGISPASGFRTETSRYMSYLEEDFPEMQRILNDMNQLQHFKIVAKTECFNDLAGLVSRWNDGLKALLISGKAEQVGEMIDEEALRWVREQSSR